MKEIVEQALDFWNLSGAAYRLIAARENHVYQVDLNGTKNALRVHRMGYRTDLELWSELQWMNAVSNGGLHVPNAVPSNSGEFLHVVEGVQIDVLTWMAGSPLGVEGEALELTDRAGLFHKIGHEMALLHRVSDDWTLPEKFTRPSWDRNGLVGKAPVWDRFWDNPTLAPEDRKLFQTIRDIADFELARLESDLDYGLIHADLVRENVMVDEDNLQFIDFDDGGFGFRLFEIATTLMANLHEPDFPTIQAALLQGYQDVRNIDITALDLIMLLRSLTYVGWIIKRMGEEGSDARNERYISRSRMLAMDYLDKRNQ